MAGWSNGARPIHYEFLTRVGFQVPPWLVTNDPAAARRFVAAHGGDVFVKSVGHSRTISSKFSEEHARNLENLRNCPTLFQKAIHGPDVRVHVVGEQCFGVRITSRADDYRYAGGCPVQYSPTELPPKVASLCVEATRHLGLVFSGIDLKVCERTGKWYCFEANPMPGYSHYDRYLSGSIAAALVEYLENGHAWHRLSDAGSNRIAV
jgi:glutathione synthase/RimK-type ligase-like ATP-grasp enzyme